MQHRVAILELERVRLLVFEDSGTAAAFASGYNHARERWDFEGSATVIGDTYPYHPHFEGTKTADQLREMIEAPEFKIETSTRIAL